MENYPITCRYCGTKIVSHKSFEASESILLAHIEFRHPINAED